MDLLHKNKIKTLAVALLVGGFSSLSFAMNSAAPNYFYPAHLVLQVGGFNATQGKSQEIAIQDLIGDHFTIRHRQDQNALFGLGVFMDGCQTNWASLMYGLNAYALLQNTVKGDVIQENMFANLSYRYRIANYPIYAAGKAIFNSNSDKYNITLDAGIGPNIIHTSNFTETSLDGGITIPDNAFKGQTDVTFSASVGLGIKFNNVWNCFPVEIGYRFFYLGETNLKKANDQILSHLKTGNSYANALLISTSI